MANYYQKAINAVFYANPVKLQQLIDEGHFIPRLLEDTGLASKPFPIWRITQCWLEAFGGKPTGYIEEVQATVTDFYARCLKIKGIFESVFNVEFTPINYQDYWQDFYCEDPSSSEDDCLDYESPEELAKYGTTQLDIDLYCAAVKFDFPQVIDLLKKGANPHAPTCDDKYDRGACERIGMECSYLDTCRLSYAWSPKVHDSIGDDEIGDLIGWAAHESMYRCIHRYNTVSEEYEPRSVYLEEMHPANTSIWPVYEDWEDSTYLVLDGARCWFMAINERELDLNKYQVCIKGLEKDFMKEFSMSDHKSLIDTIIKEFDYPESLDKMLARVAGKKEFEVWDFRDKDNATSLERALVSISRRNQGVSREYQMRWYYDVVSCLRKEGLDDDEIAKMLQKQPIPVLWLRNHGGKTPETLARMYIDNNEIENE